MLLVDMDFFLFLGHCGVRVVTQPNHGDIVSFEFNGSHNFKYIDIICFKSKSFYNFKTL